MTMNRAELIEVAAKAIAAQGFWDDLECAEIAIDAVEQLIRTDERWAMERQAANVIITRTDEGLTYSVDDPHDLGWVPVSLELIPKMAATWRALFDLRNRVEALHDKASRMSAYDDLDVGLMTAYRKVLALIDEVLI